MRIPSVSHAAVLLLAVCLQAGCSSSGGRDEASASGNMETARSAAKEASAMALTIRSNAFEEGARIPVQYTCDDKDLSPALTWEGAPEGTKSYALICDDPDAPMGTWVHWVIFNIPADSTGLPEGLDKAPRLDDGTIQGKNSWGRHGYGGPCPPPGKPHRYFFKLYALDTTLDLDDSARKNDLLAAMKGHVLAEAQTMGTYGR